MSIDTEQILIYMLNHIKRGMIIITQLNDYKLQMPMV